jgi:signal transduction histidine kinase
VILPPGSRRIEIEYTALSFNAPDKVRFQIKLEDNDEDWHDEGNRRSALFQELLPGDYTFRVRAANNHGVWNEAGASLAFTVRPLFWQTVWFRAATGFAALAEAGLIVGLVWLNRRRRRAELEIQRQRTELAHMARVTTMGEFAASLAHELNHPQSAILSNAQAGELFLHADPPVLDEVRKIFSDIVRDNRRATEIIQRLRTFLRKGEIAVEPVSINALVREIVPLVELDLGVRKVMLRLDLSDGLPSARADRVHLQQVLLNLILNAMDAMSLVPPDARELRIETRAGAAHTIEVAVSDTGTGIPADKLANIFEPFYTSKEHGLGMGLSIARTIVDAHSGRIWAENNPARGASVRFTLPVNRAEP